MDTKQLQTLIAIAEKGTFARAATTVFLTPSAVSQQIRALEQELKVELFDRSTRPSTLNPKGLQMVEVAKSLLSRIEDAKATITGQRLIGTLNLGSVRTSAFTLLPQAIAVLNKKYPEVKIRLRGGNSEAMLADVAAGRLDAAMIAEHMAMPSGLRWRPFIREPLIVIAPDTTAPGTAEELLTRHPYIRFSSNVPLAHIIDTELARLGVVPNEIAEIDTMSAIVACVTQGLGVSIVPHIVLPKTEDHPLVWVPFGEPPVYRQLGLVEQISNPRQEIISMLHEELARVSHPYGADILEN